MSLRTDAYSESHQAIALTPATISSSTTTVGAIIDTKGYSSVTFYLFLGTKTDGTYTPTLTEGDDSGLSGGTTVAAGSLIGSYAGATPTSTGQIVKLGYICGPYRYVRLSVVSATVTTGCTNVGAVVVLGTPLQGPVA